MESIHIEGLSEETLASASRLVDAVFTNEEYSPSLTLQAALRPEEHRAFWEEHQLVHLRYWVAIGDGRVVGISGTYGKQEDIADAFWLSWFCVDPAYRGQGLGKRLLTMAEDNARSHGKKLLRLYTSTNPEEAAAQALYDKSGYRITSTKKAPHNGEKRVFREKVLSEPRKAS